MTADLPIPRPTLGSLFRRYAEVLSSEDRSMLKPAVAELKTFADQRGLSGATALADLAWLQFELFSQDGSADKKILFSFFYRFVFFVSREKGHRSLAVSTATQAWRLLLDGRFGLLEHWCGFVMRHQQHGISEDTWQQVLEFSLTITTDLSNYDCHGAWPVLIDEFVDCLTLRFREGLSCPKCQERPPTKGGNPWMGAEALCLVPGAPTTGLSGSDWFSGGRENTTFNLPPRSLPPFKAESITSRTLSAFRRQGTEEAHRPAAGHMTLSPVLDHEQSFRMQTDSGASLKPQEEFRKAPSPFNCFPASSHDQVNSGARFKTEGAGEERGSRNFLKQRSVRGALNEGASRRKRTWAASEKFDLGALEEVLPPQGLPSEGVDLIVERMAGLDGPAARKKPRVCCVVARTCHNPFGSDP